MNQCQTNNQSIRQSVKESVNQWSKEAKNQWINEWVKQRDDESLNQRISDSMNQWTDEPVDQSLAQQTSESMNEWMNQWNKWSTNQQVNEPMNRSESMSHGFNKPRISQSMNKWINQWISEPVNHWINEPILWVNESTTNQRINKWTNEWTEPPNCKPAEQERRAKSTSVRAALTMWTILRYSYPLSLLRFLVKPSSHHSLAHILRTASSKSAPRTSFFSPPSCVPNSSSKSAPHPSIFFKHWSENQALATVLYNFPRSRPALPEPSFGDTLRARECFYRWTHTLPSCSPSQLLDDGRLPFWWEC